VKGAKSGKLDVAELKKRNQIYVKDPKSTKLEITKKESSKFFQLILT
jgi:hypothetical protein